MKLPGWSFMLVGVILMAYSRFIEARSDANLAIFFWIGAGLVVYGFLRECLRFFTRKKTHELVGPPARHEVEHDHRHPAGHQYHGVSPQATHAHLAPAQHPSHPYEPANKKCPRCFQVNTYRAKFCHQCGFQFHA